jgi:hypothetical protein
MKYYVFNIISHKDVHPSIIKLLFPVELPNGLEIWWDGVTRVYIDVPASFQGNTKV